MAHQRPITCPSSPQKILEVLCQTIARWPPMSNLHHWLFQVIGIGFQSQAPMSHLHHRGGGQPSLHGAQFIPSTCYYLQHITKQRAVRRQSTLLHWLNQNEKCQRQVRWILRGFRWKPQLRSLMNRCRYPLRFP
eukprot:PhF_6_TR27203/c0_g1_i1/m.39996